MRRGYGLKPPVYKEYKLTLKGDVPYLAAEAEKLSRTWFLDVLKQAGFSGKANQWNPDAAVPDEIEKLLTDMSFIAQFRAVRQLHAAIAAGGESPALLAALVRGYTNLGMLTEYHWHPAHRSFKARALLYAQRMAAHDEKSAWTRWHRAYALAIIGLHKFALEDIEAAERDAKTAAAKAPAEPAWVPIITAYCHYDLDRLTALGAGSSQAQLAGLLAFCSAELADDSTLASAQARKFLPSMPECYRLYDGLCAYGDLDEIQQGARTPADVLGAELYPDLAAISGLPESVTEYPQAGRRGKGSPGKPIGRRANAAGQEFRTRGRLMAALRAADAPAADANAGAAGPADRGEPSWPALGRLIAETSFLQTWRRLRSANPVGQRRRVPGTCRAAGGGSPLSGIPRKPYEQFRGAEDGPRAVGEDRRADGRHRPAQGLRRGQRRGFLFETLASRRPGHDSRHGPRRQRPRVCGKRVPNSDYRQNALRRLLEVSPDSPYARASLIECDWPSVRRQAAAWEKDAGRQPALLVALAKRHEQDGEYSAAVRCLKTAVRVAPQESTCNNLARIYWKQGQKEQCIATLEELLHTPTRALPMRACVRRLPSTSCGTTTGRGRCPTPRRRRKPAPLGPS